MKSKENIQEEQILVRVTGQDRPGLTASIMGILAKYDARILDIGQADIHATLSLGILIRTNEDNSGKVMKDLLFKATELGVNIGFSPITDDEYENWVNQQGKNRIYLNYYRAFTFCREYRSYYKSNCCSRYEYRLYCASYWSPKHKERKS